MLSIRVVLNLQRAGNPQTPNSFRPTSFCSSDLPHFYFGPAAIPFYSLLVYFPVPNLSAKHWKNTLSNATPTTPVTHLLLLSAAYLLFNPCTYSSRTLNLLPQRAFTKIQLFVIQGLNLFSNPSSTTQPRTIIPKYLKSEHFPSVLYAT